ncbi:MAG TPA: DUF4097 family beta strand repeat-containing protein [Candidatus Dormibacteraeota bacterium]|nr:DUF4097 family beta strand repeat-containing protein [Candidatus Dormibacteraeota bacterium]
MLIRLALVLVAVLTAPAAAWAAQVDAPVGPQAIVVVDVHQANVVVREGPGTAVRIVATGARVERRTYTPTAGDRRVHVLPVSVQTRDGARITLSGESFTMAPLRAAPHDDIRVVGGDVGSVAIQVPQRTALVLVKMERGRLRVEGLRHATLLAKIRRGVIAVTDFAGAGYLQVAQGVIGIDGSMLRHVRLRTGIGAIVLRDCTIAQTQATSIRGDVIVDDAAFLPGMARFDSRSGAVALGVGESGAQVSGSTAAGRIFTLLDGRSHPQIDRGVVSATVHGGGPAVTLRSERGNLFLYDGSLLHRATTPPWARIEALLERL